jgi:hypothetical protein
MRIPVLLRYRYAQKSVPTGQAESGTVVPEPKVTALWQESNDAWKHQHKRLDEFATKFHGKLQLISAEIQGDLMVLRERGFDKELQKQLFKVWQEVISVAHSFNPETVAAKKLYLAAQAVVSYVKLPATRAILDNLDFLAKHHLKKTNVDLGVMTPGLGHPQFKSLGLLISLADYLEKYMADNPLLEQKMPTPSQLTSTVPPPIRTIPPDEETQMLNIK